MGGIFCQTGLYAEPSLRIPDGVPSDSRSILRDGYGLLSRGAAISAKTVSSLRSGSLWAADVDPHILVGEAKLAATAMLISSEWTDAAVNRATAKQI